MYETHPIKYCSRNVFKTGMLPTFLHLGNKSHDEKKATAQFFRNSLLNQTLQNQLGPQL